MAEQFQYETFKDVEKQHLAYIEYSRELNIEDERQFNLALKGLEELKIILRDLRKVVNTPVLTDVEWGHHLVYRRKMIRFYHVLQNIVRIITAAYDNAKKIFDLTEKDLNGLRKIVMGLEESKNKFNFYSHFKAVTPLIKKEYSISEKIKKEDYALMGYLISMKKKLRDLDLVLRGLITEANISQSKRDKIEERLHPPNLSILKKSEKAYSEQIYFFRRFITQLFDFKGIMPHKKHVKTINNSIEEMDNKVSELWNMFKENVGLSEDVQKLLKKSEKADKKVIRRIN